MAQMFLYFDRRFPKQDFMLQVEKFTNQEGQVACVSKFKCFAQVDIEVSEIVTLMPKFPFSENI